MRTLKNSKQNQKNNLSNELALCGTLSIVYGFVPAWIVYRVISTQNAVLQKYGALSVDFRFALPVPALVGRERIS